MIEIIDNKDTLHETFGFDSKETLVATAELNGNERLKTMVVIAMSLSNLPPQTSIGMTILLTAIAGYENETLGGLLKYIEANTTEHQLEIFAMELIGLQELDVEQIIKDMK